jgi:exportin-T
VSLEIVNNAVQTQTLDSNSLTFLKEALLDYVRRTYVGAPENQVDPPSLQNKVTQTLTYLFVYMYRDGWTTFIDDFLALTSLPSSRQRDNPAGVILYLRMLGSVHDEIADAFLSRQGGDAKRNTDLKDLIRERDMHKIATSLRELLSQYANQNDYILEMTLKVIGKWVAWIDISLVINQDMLNLLFPLVGRVNPAGGEDKVRDAAIDALTEVVGKKMKPADKTDMIAFLNLRELISQLVASPALNEFQKTPKYDTDLAETVAKLVNTVMADIVRVLEDGEVGNDVRARAEQLLHDFLPHLIRFFSDDYDEVCSTVIPSLADLLTFLRKVPSLPQAYVDMLPPILNAIVLKMRYDETSSWGLEDEQTDEAEFQELRKRLQNLQKSIAAVDQNLYIEILSNLVANTFQTLDQQGPQLDWRDLDLALHELDLFGELALPNTGVTKSKQPSSTASERLVAIMRKMIDSGWSLTAKQAATQNGRLANRALEIAQFPHPAILLQYMEICTRYSAFFESNQEYIPRVLENFVRLVHHDHHRVRVRSWYLFLRLVKQLRGHVGNVAETVIQSISDLLPIRAELPRDDADEDIASDETDHSYEALFTSQLYLFEAIGCISSTQATPVEKQALYVRSVMEPLFVDMEHHLSNAKNGDAQAVLQIHHIIVALGTLAYGFSSHPSGPANNRLRPELVISDEFARATEAILIALGALNSHPDIRTACRSAFSRLLNVLGAAVLPQLPQWIEGLLSQSSSMDEMALFLRLLEQVVFEFKGQIYNVLNQLLTPLLQRIFAGLSEPITGTDDEIQLAELRREYLSFLQVILSNELEGVLVSDANQGFFEPMISSIIAMARLVGQGIGSSTASRFAFIVLSKMTAVWGGADLRTIPADASEPVAVPAPAIPGFDKFVIERFHSVCWEVLQDPQFKPSKDAQAKQVLSEIAGLEQSIYTKTGDLFIQHLQRTLFPSMGIDGAQFLTAMTTTDRKQFTNYLQSLLVNRT